MTTLPLTRIVSALCACAPLAVTTATSTAISTMDFMGVLPTDVLAMLMHFHATETATDALLYAPSPSFRGRPTAGTRNRLLRTTLDSGLALARAPE